MPKLTVEQADELADQTLNLKIAVGDFRDAFFDVLTPAQRDGLRIFAAILGDEVDHLTAVAIRLTLVDLHGTLADLCQITDGVKKEVAHLSDIRKVITVATALVSLGTTIASANPDAVLAALKDTATSIKG